MVTQQLSAVVPQQPTADDPPPRVGRSEIALATQQLAAVQSWHHSRAQQEGAGTGAHSREARMDLARRIDVLRRQHEAIVRRAEEQLRASGELLHSVAPTRAVIAHRNQWFQEKVAEGLRRLGVAVVARLDNGADAVGTVVAEQPDLLLVEDQLPMQTGFDVVRQTRVYSPDTVIVAQVAYDDRVGEMIEAGARAAYTRRTPPADLTAELGRLLQV